MSTLSACSFSTKNEIQYDGPKKVEVNFGKVIHVEND